MGIRPRLGASAEHPADRVAQDDLPASVVGEVAGNLNLMTAPRQRIGQIAGSALFDADFHVAQPLPAWRIQCRLRV